MADVIAIVILIVLVALVVVAPTVEIVRAIHAKRKRWRVVVRPEGQGMIVGVQRGKDRKAFCEAYTISDLELAEQDEDVILDKAALLAAKLNKLDVG